MKRIPVLFVLLQLTLGVSAQSYQFFNFGIPEGLCDNFAYTINQDPQGFLWVGTTQGLCRYDGKVFEQDFRGDSIPISIAWASLLDSRGRLWFGHENGLISLLEDGKFTLVEPGDDYRSKITAIREDSEGNILVLGQQSGLMVITPDLEITYPGQTGDGTGPFSGKFSNDFRILEDGTLLVGTQNGLSIYRYDPDLGTYIETGDISELMYLVVQEIVPAKRMNEFWIGTEDEGLFRIRGEGYDPANYEVEKIGSEQGLDYARITSIVFDGERRVWITNSGVGIHRIELDAAGNMGSSVLFNTENGIPNNNIYEVYVDEEGNQWFSSQGNGIAVLRDQAFTFFNVWEDEDPEDISAIHIENEDHWFGGMGKIVFYSATNPDQKTYYGEDRGVPRDQITALYVSPQGDLYIGTEQSGLFIKRSGSGRITPLVVSRNSLDNIVNAIDGNDTHIFVATNNGIYSIDLSTGSRLSITTVNGLPHNAINDILVDDQDRVWVATQTSGLLSVGINEAGELERNTDAEYWIEGKPNYEFVTLGQDEHGNIWAGTDGNGIFKFNEDSLGWYTEEDGLFKDFSYAISIDPKGFVWVGHRSGLSRINPETGIIRKLSTELGFTSDVLKNSVAMAEDGKMYIGTTDGIILYDAFQAREDTVAPRLSLKSVVISDTPYEPTEDIRLKYDRYRIRIDFVGINLSNPEQVTYQFKLDGYEEEWSDMSTVPYANYGRVEDGEYTFMLRACDGNGNCSMEPLSLNISVKIPIWKAWWFILSAVLLVLATIFIIFKIRERNQKAIQEYLQRQLDERTREVIQQKEEIEIKNRDITDSINYAQRIQASILPPIKKLHEAFTGSFVFYQPRDIVSGDFYWYEQVDTNRFIIVCADSTGHGVPGAFMSMIGTTLIKDICLRSGVQKPSQVLTTLDNEVRESLNQNVEASGGSNDGMDIIVAEVDMRTMKFTVSSAMRPVIIYSGGEQIYVKGSRSSVGGQLDEDKTEKDFIDQEFNLKKGDIIYMFSDGYPDQFGGPLGRKFKMVRLKNLLRDIHDKPMDEQYNYIKSNFFLWKEDLEQVDDVLFMGIKL